MIVSIFQKKNCI